jgi:hypothetical protein
MQQMVVWRSARPDLWLVGFLREGVDYDETFASIAIYSIRAVIFIYFEMGWNIYQMDVKIAFLNDIIEEEVYIDQP